MKRLLLYSLSLMLGIPLIGSQGPHGKLEVVTEPIYWIDPSCLTHNELCPYFHHEKGFFSLTPTTLDDPLCGGATPKPESEILKELPAPISDKIEEHPRHTLSPHPGPFGEWNSRNM